MVTRPILPICDGRWVVVVVLLMELELGAGGNDRGRELEKAIGGINLGTDTGGWIGLGRGDRLRDPRKIWHGQVPGVATSQPGLPDSKLPRWKSNIEAQSTPDDRKLVVINNKQQPSV